VNDEKHYAIFEEVSKRNENIDVAYVKDVNKYDTRVKVYINVKPENKEDICFIDSWCLSDEIPQAHIISKHDNVQKMKQICEILEINL
tara:strand:+ start:10598 stop:10861 length:264 start_codon:yes stop_codon:yes gene_type:complete